MTIMSLSNKLIIFSVLLVGALAVGFFYISSPAALWNSLNNLEEPFVLIQLSHHSDEGSVYIPRVREVYDGHWPANDFYFDYNWPSIFPNLPSLVLGKMLHLFGGDIDLLYISANFIFSAFIFVLFYALAMLITKNNWWSILVAFIGILTPVVLHLPRVFMGPRLFLDIFFSHISNS